MTIETAVLVGFGWVEKRKEIKLGMILCTS